MKFSNGTEIRFLAFNECSTTLWHQILKLRSDVFVVEQACIYPDPDAQDADAVHVVLLNGEDLLAYARVYDQSHRHIGRIIVNPTHRGKGHGKQIIQACLDQWEQSEHNSILMSAQVYLSDYYQSFGFNPVGSMYLEDGIPHLQMVKHRSS